MMRIAVYTTVLCGRDSLREPGCGRVPGVDFICFGDTPPNTQRTAWQFRPAAKISGDPRMVARFYKLNPQLLLPDYDWWLWIDGSMRVRQNPAEMVASVKRADIITFRHRSRACAYDEGRRCINDKRAPFEDVMRQLEDYRKRGLPEQFGLYETGVLLRRNCRDTVVLNAEWWAEVQKHTVRDQISLPMVQFELGLPINMFDGDIGSNYWCDHLPHPYMAHPAHFAEIYGEHYPAHVRDWLERQREWQS